jgi:hypothetical protein
MRPAALVPCSIRTAPPPAAAEGDHPALRCVRWEREKRVRIGAAQRNCRRSWVERAATIAVRAWADHTTSSRGCAEAGVSGWGRSCQCRRGCTWATKKRASSTSASDSLMGFIDYSRLIVLADGFALLTAAYATTAPPELRTLPAIEILRQVWLQNFTITDGKTGWREPDNIPPTGRYIASPYALTPVTPPSAKPIGSATKSTVPKPMATISPI